MRHGEGKVWISTWGHGCGYVVGDTLTILSRADSLLDDRVTCVVEQSDYTIWIGTDSGVCRADSFSWTPMRYGSRIPVGRVRDIILAEEGDLFVSVARQGVAKYSLGRVNRYGPGQGLPDRDIYKFGLDAEAKVWAAGRFGLSTWDGSGWTPLRLPGIPLGERDYLSVGHDLEGNTYLGTSRGMIASVARDSYRERVLPGSGPDMMIGLIVRSGRTVLMSGSRAVYRFDGGFTPVGLPGKWFEGAVTGLVPEQGGRMWLSTRFGILHHNGNSWEVFDRRQGLPTEHFTCAAAGNDGELWFGTFDSGVLRLDFGGLGPLQAKARTAGREDIFDSCRPLREGMGLDTVRQGRGVHGCELGETGYSGNGSGEGTDRHACRLDLSGGSLGQDTALTGGGTGGAFAPVIGLDGSGRCMFCTEEGIFFLSEAGWRLIDLPLRRQGPRPTALRGTDRRKYLARDRRRRGICPERRQMASCRQRERSR